jgi:hypothetical protein
MFTALKVGKKKQARIRQIVVDSPRQDLPVDGLLVGVPEGRHDHARGRAHSFA